MRVPGHGKLVQSLAKRSQAGRCKFGRDFLQPGRGASGSGIPQHDRARRRPRPDLGAGRHRAAEHPGPDPAPGVWLQAIRDKQGPTEAFFKTCAALSDTPEEQIYQWIEKFFTLWSRNQWKRERYAPSFHVDDENLDPKTWCRFPILSGGFDLELAELRAEIIRLKARQREE